MKNNAGVLPTGGVLAATGLTGHPLWSFLAAFALIALGLAIWRIVPRRES